MKLLTRLGLLVSALAFTACAETKPIPENTDDVAPQADIMPIRNTGTVTMAFKDEGCDVLIQMTSKSDFEYLTPVELDSNFRKEGLNLRFNFVPSRNLSLFSLPYPLPLQALSWPCCYRVTLSLLPRSSV